MAATLTVPDEMIVRAERSARRLGISVETTLLRILDTGLPDIPDELRDEFEQWETASDEDFERWLSREESVRESR
jgi:hypothetical protein